MASRERRRQPGRRLRDPNPNAPLKKVVMYTGNTIKPDNTSLDLTIKGINGSASAKSAKITHIVSSGQPNSRLRFSFAGAGAASATDNGGKSVHRRSGVAAVVGQPDGRRRVP